MKKIELDDEVVIYPNHEDGGWIAHSLRTDQIGIGDSIVESLADVMRAVDQVCRAAEKDETLAYLREAPGDIKEILARAKPLPKEIFEVAHWKVHGRWPRGWSDPQPEDGGDAFKAEIREPASC